MSQRKKIRLILIAPAEPLIGGQAVQAQRLVSKFKLEDELDVRFLPINPQFLAPLQKIKFVRTIVTTFRYLIGLLFSIPSADIVHVFSASFFSFYLSPAPAILIAKLFRKRVVLNYRSGYLEKHLTEWPAAIRFMKMADEIVVPSGYLVDVFSKFGIEARSVVNFVDTENFEFRERTVLEPKFLSNRSFEGLYNVACVIRAFSKIKPEFPEATLSLAGNGILEKELRDLVDELRLEGVTFLGPLNQKEMAKAYWDCDLLLNSPNIDNMPNSLIEAFASGIPIVSTNAGGIPYLVDNGRTGLLVEVGDCEKLAGESMRILRNPDLARQIISNAKEESLKYEWTEVRSQWLSLYRELAN